jgi:hypothetical protein
MEHFKPPAPSLTTEKYIHRYLRKCSRGWAPEREFRETTFYFVAVIYMYVLVA